MNHRVILAVALVAVVTTAGIAQTTRLVPGQYATIQAAINAAASGDTVLVSPGTYPQSINFLGKAITVVSVGGPAATTLTASPNFNVVTFATNEGPASTLNGFTITAGGGVQIQNSSPTILNCHIVNNVRTGPGAGIYCTSTGTGTASPSIVGTTINNNISLTPSNNISSGLAFEGLSSSMSFPSVTNCTVASNSHAQGTAGDDGGVWLVGSFNATFTGCSFENHASGSGCLIGGAATFTSCRIVGNHADYGGAIFFQGSSLSLVNCLIAQNSATGLAGALYMFTSSSNPPSSLVIKNCTIASNTAGAWCGGIITTGSGAPLISISNTVLRGNSGTQLEAPSASVTYSDVGFGLFSPGVGTIDADPLFLDEAGGDFHLSTASPCRNAGAPGTTGLPATDFDGGARIVGGVVDMGCDEIPPITRPGTADGLDLYGWVNGAGDPLASTRPAAAGSLLTVRMKSSTGSLVGGLPIFGAELFPNAVPPVALGPVWLDYQAVIVYGALSAPPFSFPGLPPEGLSFNFTVPPGLGGMTVRMQGLVSSINALNGTYAASNATEVTF